MAAEVGPDQSLAQQVDLRVVVAVLADDLLPPVGEVSLVIVSCLWGVAVDLSLKLVVPIDVKVDEGHARGCTGLEEFEDHGGVLPHLLEQVAVLVSVDGLLDVLRGLNLLGELHVLELFSEVGLLFLHLFLARLQIRESLGILLFAFFALLSGQSTVDCLRASEFTRDITESAAATRVSQVIRVDRSLHITHLTAHIEVINPRWIGLVD